MIFVKKLSVMLIIAALFFAGCVGVAEPEGELPDEGIPPIVSCRTTTEEVPYVEEECDDVTYSQEECEMRALNYTAGSVRVTDLCIEGQPECVGANLGGCINKCTRAMKRCRMNITNNDKDYDGTWTVGATYSYDGASFIKNPESADISPGKTYTFDFTQIYDVGSQNPTMATCTLTLIYEAIVKDCRMVTRKAVECKNVTKTRIIEREICE